MPIPSSHIRKSLSLAAPLLAGLALAAPVEASVFNFTFTSVADNTEFDNFYVDNVAFGDSFVVIIAADNGGSSQLNQTWTAADVLSVTFDFGNGAHRTVFDPNGGDGMEDTSGNFVTDALGALIAVPDSWLDETNVNVLSTNSAQTPDSWYLNDLNDKYYTDSGEYAVGIANAVDNTLAANWTVAPAASVPEIDALSATSALTLLGFGLALAGHRRRAA